MNTTENTINLTTADLLKVSGLLASFCTHRKRVALYGEDAADAERTGANLLAASSRAKHREARLKAENIYRDLHENYGIDMHAICQAIDEEAGA